jgi:DNA-binding transcriptional LysR family regulator
MDNIDLLALADFNLVARYRGFGRAARAAGRTKATLSRRVAELESSLDLRLLERGARTLQLTQEGQALYERTEALLTELHETASAIADGGARPHGRLRISTPLLFSQTVLGKLAAGFAQRNPEVRLEATAEDRLIYMVEEGYDLVIRANPDPDETLVGRIIVRDRLRVVASPALIRPTDNSAVPAVVRGSQGQHSSWAVTPTMGVTSIAVRPVLRLSSMISIRDAVREGVGAACLPASLVKQDLATGRLVHWGDVHGSDIHLWALYPSRRLLSARVSAFLAYLVEVFPTGSSDEFATFMAE